MIAIHSALVKTLAPVTARDLAEDYFFLTGGVGNIRYLDTGPLSLLTKFLQMWVLHWMSMVMHKHQLQEY